MACAWPVWQQAVLILAPHGGRFEMSCVPTNTHNAWQRMETR